MPLNKSPSFVKLMQIILKLSFENFQPNFTGKVREHSAWSTFFQKSADFCSDSGRTFEVQYRIE